MPKVEKINTTEYLYSEQIKTNKFFANLVAMMKESGINDPLSMLPKKPSYEVSFELHDCYTALANAFNKCIIDEIPTYCMTFSHKDLITDDLYILIDDWQKKISLIRIEQTPGLKFSLDVTNKTGKVINVYACHLTATLNGKSIPIEQVIPGLHTIIGTLNPMSYVKINNIDTIKGLNRTDGKFASTGPVRYQILDLKPDKNDKNENKMPSGESSVLMSNYKQFRISYLTYRNCEPYYIIITACNTLIERLERLANMMESKDTADIKIEIDNSVHSYSFGGEHFMLASLIAQNCYLLDDKISFVAPSISHPSIDVGIVKIVHSEPDKLILDAIKKSITDITIVKKAFTK